MLHYDNLIDLHGNAIAGATVTIRDDEGELVTIPGGNPRTTDATGYWDAELEAGVYTVVFQKGLSSITRTVTLGGAGGGGEAGAGYGGTSTTSQTIASSGSKAFTTQAGLAYEAGSRVRVARTSAPTTTWMEGIVTAYSGTTLTVTMDLAAGAGTHTDWSISLAGERGATGAAGANGEDGEDGEDGEIPTDWGGQEIGNYKPKLVTVPGPTLTLSAALHMGALLYFTGECVVTVPDTLPAAFTATALSGTDDEVSFDGDGLDYDDDAFLPALRANKSIGVLASGVAGTVVLAGDLAAAP